MTSNEEDVREFIFEKGNLTNKKYDWWAIEDTMDIEGFNEIIAEYEKNIKLLIKKLIKSDESISQQLEILKDDIDSKIKGNYLKLINPKMVNHILISHTKTPKEKLFHYLHLKEAWSM